MNEKDINNYIGKTNSLITISNNLMNSLVVLKQYNEKTNSLHNNKEINRYSNDILKKLIRLQDKYNAYFNMNLEYVFNVNNIPLVADTLNINLKILIDPLKEKFDYIIKKRNSKNLEYLMPNIEKEFKSILNSIYDILENPNQYNDKLYNS